MDVGGAGVVGILQQSLHDVLDWVLGLARGLLQLETEGLVVRCVQLPDQHLKITVGDEV